MKMNYQTILGILLTWILSIQNASTQELITDRPDQTESSITVPKGSLQWESGFWYEKDTKILKASNSQIHSFGYNSSLLRYGILQNIELRLGGNIVGSHILFDRMGLLETVSFTTDLEPIYTGLKIKLMNESGMLPEIAILGHISIPMLSTTDNEDISSDITLAGSYTLSESIGFGFNIGSHWSGLGIDLPNWFYSAVLGISHGEKLSSYWEIYGWKLAKSGANDLRADAGLTYLLKPNLQLDFSAGIGLSEYNPDFFINIGFSWRIPQ